MTIRVFRPGSPRAAAEGLRTGTLRPPRAVPEAPSAPHDRYEVGYPASRCHRSVLHALLEKHAANVA